MFASTFVPRISLLITATTFLLGNSSGSIIIDAFKPERSLGGTKIGSDNILLVDSQLAIVAALTYENSKPFTYFTIRLRSANIGTDKDFDRYGSYRDNLIVDFNSTEECERPAEFKSENVILRLPQEIKWSEVAWLGIYSYANNTVFNHVWVHPTWAPEDITRVLESLPKHEKKSGSSIPECKQNFHACEGSENPLYSFCYNLCENHNQSAAELPTRNRFSTRPAPGNAVGC